MPIQSVKQQLTRINQALERVRDDLFECSRECMRDEGELEWHNAEQLFDLAKRAAAFRHDILTILNGTTRSDAEPLSRRATAEYKKSVQQKPPKKRKSDYPKYSVRGDVLIKVGLGRDRRSEYEQTVPKAEFDKIIARLRSISGSRKEFSAEEAQSALDCPVYQTYIVLLLLRQSQLLDMPRRGVYKFRSPQTFTADATAAWVRLQAA
jgi:hypothetical protein